MTAIWSLMRKGFGLWICEKAFNIPTLPQTLFFFFCNGFPKKYALKSPPEGGEGNKKAAKEEKMPVLVLYPNKLFTLPIKL